MTGLIIILLIATIIDISLIMLLPELMEHKKINTILVLLLLILAVCIIVSIKLILISCE